MPRCGIPIFSYFLNLCVLVLAPASSHLYPCFLATFFFLQCFSHTHTSFFVQKQGDIFLVFLDIICYICSCFLSTILCCLSVYWERYTVCACVFIYSEYLSLVYSNLFLILLVILIHIISIIFQNCIFYGQ